MSQVEAILADFDGTLADSERANVDYYQRMFTELFETDLEADYIRARLHLTVRAFLEDAMPNKSPDELDADYAQTRELPYHDEWVALMPGAKKAIEELADKKWGVVSSRDGRSIRDFLDRENLAPFFGAVVAYGDYQRSKPDPEPVATACNRLAVEVSAAVYLGDHEVDVQAGQAAGTTPVFFGPLHGPAGASVVESWSELPGVIREIEGSVG